MLTGNRSMFLSTEGSLAWLYNCPLMRSPPHVMNQCYDKIPIFYPNAIFFVDPITRQTYPGAQVQNCSDQINNFLQFDMENKNFWFTITHTLEHRNRPAVFGPKNVTPLSRRVFGGAGDAGTYSRVQRVQLSELGDNILISAVPRKALQNFSRKLIVPNTAIHRPEQNSYYVPRTDFYVDNMISPSYFKNPFMDTFGSIAYVLEFCEFYFFCFLFIKFIVDFIVMVLRHMEIHRLTGASLRFGIGKTLLSASFNLFLTSFLTSVFNPQAPLLQALEAEPTPARLVEETGDPIDENKKKEEHLYPIVHHPTTALCPVSLALRGVILNCFLWCSFRFFILSWIADDTRFPCWNTTNSIRC